MKYKDITNYAKILLIILIAFFYIKVAIADLIPNISTTNSCSAGQVALLRLQNDSGGYENSHAQSANYSGTLYGNTLCASSTNNPNLNNTCGTSFLRLSNNTNAHVQNSSNTTYGYPACISLPSTNAAPICGTYLDNCPSQYTCILSIASNTGNNATNAHVGSCNKYQTKVCCRVNSPPNLPILNLPLNNTFTSDNTPEFFINNSDDMDNDAIYYVLEISTDFAFSNTSYYNGTIRKIVNTTNGHNLSSALSDGNYYWRARATDLQGNSSITEIRNITIDTTLPVPVYDSRTEINNTYVQRNWTFINITLTETNLANITYTIANSSFVNNTIYGSRILQINFTNLVDGNYTYNVTVRDLANNVNSTETRTITIDTRIPVITYSSDTEINNTYKNQNYILINTTLTEINFANITFLIFNTTSKVNESFFNNRTNQINIAVNNLNENYTYNVTVRDLANNVNSTDTRKIILDNTLPLISYLPETEANNTYVNRNYILINTTLTEANFANITFLIFNTTSKVNESFFNNRTNQINITVNNLNQQYTYNATIRDLANNVNTTETRIIILDNTLPTNFTLISPSNNTISNNRTPLLTWNNTIEVNFDNYTIDVDNDADFSSVQFTFIRINNISNSTIQTTSPWNDNTRYFWRVKVTDKANNQNSTTFTYTTDNTNPTVTLDSPTDNQWLTTNTVNLKYIPTDAPFNSDLQACDLYGNFTSSTFQKNNTQTPVGGAINTFTLILPDSSYAWNVQCNDSAGNLARAPSNFTVNIDTVKPSLSYSSQTEINNTYINSNSIFVNWSYTETNFANLTFRLFNATSSVNITVYNTTPFYQINVTGINSNERYTYNITLKDYSNQENITETRIITLDTTFPLINFSSQTLTNNTYINSNSIFVNWSYTETNFANLTFTLANLTGIVNQTIYNTTAYQINFTQLQNTNYTYNVTIRDLANNVNTTDTRTLVLDNIIPVSVYDNALTLANNTYFNRNWTFINITLTETNLANITYTIANSSFVNNTIYGSRILQINFTNLVDGNYTYNVTVRDLANNVNSTETRTIVIDTRLPVPVYDSRTEINDTYVGRNWTYINITLTETNLANITYTIANSSFVNNTIYGSRILQINFTNLVDGNYTYNVTIRDLANNVNSTETRTIVIDTRIPSISYSSQTLANNSFAQQNFIFVNWTYDENNVANITFRLFNTTSPVNITLYHQTTYQINVSNYTSYLINPNEKYTYNVTIIDQLGNLNITETRTLTLDNINPSSIILSLPTNNSYLNNITPLFDWSDATENNFDNYTLQITTDINFNSINNTFTLYNNAANSTINLTTSLTDLTRYYWRVLVYDKSNKFNASTQNFTFNTDATVPLISLGNRTENNNTQIRQNWIFVNITYTETNFANLTFRLFNTTSLVNETVSNSSNIIRAINFTNLSNSNNILYRYNITLVDLANNQNITETRTIILDNVLPSIPVLGNPKNDTWQLFDNATAFDWSNATDYENTTLQYEFQLSNSTTFNQTYIVRTLNISQSNFTLIVAEMPNVGRHYWKVRSFDGINNSNFSNLFEVDVVYAVINITSPSYNSIVRVLNTYNYKVEEIANPNWVQNVNITFTYGSSSSGPLVMANNSDPITNYTKNFTTPNTVSDYLTATATGWNGTRHVNATSRFRITVPETPTITRPIIIDIYSENTYTYPNVTANITVRSDLSVLLNTIAVQVLEPNGTISTLTNTENNENNFLNNSYNYEHNYTFVPGELGEHIIEVTITDINNPDSGYTAYKNNSFYVNTTSSLSLTTSGSGINNITLNDIYSKRTLNRAGNSLSASLVPGNYDLKVSTDKIDTSLVNTTINNNVGNLCAFEDIAETITVPTNSRSVDQYTLDCGNLTFNNVNMTYNYTKVLGSITLEENLKIYKCNSVNSCSWVKLNTSLTTDQNIITANFINFSAFMLSEDTAPSTTTSASAGSGAGGGSSGGLSRIVALDIIQPGNLSIYEKDTIITPLIIKNTGKTSLFGITLTAYTEQKGVGLELEDNFISALVVGEQTTRNLKIISTNFTGDRAEVVVTAKVNSPSVQDQVKFLLNLLKGGGDAAKATDQIAFANNFFNGNPECLELKELINQAQTALNNKDYAKAISLSDAAIQSCKNLLSLIGKSPELKKPAQLTDLLILGIESLVFFMLTYSMYNYYKRRKLKQIKK